MARTKNAGTFEKGHKFYPSANGVNGVNRQLRRDMTIELVSQLNELHQMPGSNERREKMH